MERKLVKAELAGESATDDLFKWLACAWALALVPAALLSVVVEWLADWAALAPVAHNAGVLMGVPIAGAVWALIRFAASSGRGRPTVADDLVVLFAAAASWALLPA